MNRNTLLLAAVFMLGTMCSCGGNASKTNEEVEETTMQETTEEIVESEDNENTVEAESEAEDAATDVVEEMIDRKNGLVVDMNGQAVCNGILELLNNNELREAIIKYLKDEKKGNTEELDKFYELIK